MAPRTIDLNADMGEGAGQDESLMALVTSANLSCGAHAGTQADIDQAITLALQHGVALGAHPGHADRKHFGRRSREISPQGLRSLLSDQVGWLADRVQRQRGRLRYLKLHGALYHQAGQEPCLAQAVVQTLLEEFSGMALLGQPGSLLQTAAQQAGLRFYAEAFADRAYLQDGRLAPRSQPDSLLSQSGQAAQQAIEIATQQTVTTVSGSCTAVSADSLCLHGDNPQAAALAQAVRDGLQAAGIGVRAFAP